MEFDELNLAELDKDLTQEERDEWQSIYASYRSGSILTSTVMGVESHQIHNVSNEAGDRETKSMRCLVVIPYRVKVIIPETELFLMPTIEGGYVLHSMGGSKVDYVITYIDRENNIAVASRKLALRKKQIATGRRLTGDVVNSIVDVNIISVGRNMCIANYGGYDVMLYQRDIQYCAIPDLRTALKPGETRKAVIKDFNPDEQILKLSIKETMAHPFDGADIRHPKGATRFATVMGKYGGGVFCRLDDGVTDVLCSYGTMHYDGDFHIGDRVEIIIKKFQYSHKLIYGKMLRKIQ